jgi:hypothetical protein
LVPSPVIATSRSARLVLADQLEFGFGGRFRQEIIDACFGGDRGGGQLVVAGDHDGANPHPAQLRKALLDAAL